MKGERTYTIIGNPSALIDRTDSNAKSNARKGKALKAYNAMQVAMGLPEVEDLPEDVDIDELEELYETEEDLATAPKKSSKKRSREEDNVEGEALKRQKRARKEKDVEKAPKEKAKAKAKATGASRK